jgi:hypothetical protein
MPIGPVLALIGGALLAIGSFLAWAEVSGGGVSTSAAGIDGTDGWITLIAGLVAIAVGLVALRAGRRMLAVLAIVAGLVGGGVGVYDALTAEDSVLDAAAEEIAPQFGASAEEVRVLLDEAIDAGQLSISISIGLYMVIVGGVLPRRGAPAPAAAGAGAMSSMAVAEPMDAGTVPAADPVVVDPPAAPVAPDVSPPAPPPSPPPPDTPTSS